jgi:hypothetical protein
MRFLFLCLGLLAGLVTLPYDFDDFECKSRTSLGSGSFGSPNRHLNGLVSKNRMSLRPHHNFECNRHETDIFAIS